MLTSKGRISANFELFSFFIRRKHDKLLTSAKKQSRVKKYIKLADIASLKEIKTYKTGFQMIKMIILYTNQTYFLFLVTVVVTRLPITNSQQLRPVLPGASQTSKIIRFLGNSFIRYDFGVLTAEMLSPSNKESLSMQFITQDEDGLIWLFEGSGNDKLHLSVKVNTQ